MSESKTRKPQGKGTAAKQQSERAQRAQQLLDEQRRQREIAGVVLLAVGLLLGVFLYFKPEGLLSEKIPGFLFGLFGFFGYVTPVAFLACGIFTIAMSAKKPQIPRSLLIVGACICVLSFAHVLVRDKFSVVQGYIGFLEDSFKQGESAGIGGGLFGALLSYPLFLLLSDVGACIVFAFALVIQLIFITNISIRAAGEKVSEAIKNNVTAMNERRVVRKEVRKEEKRLVEDERKRFFDQVSLDDNSGEMREQKTEYAKSLKTQPPEQQDDNLSIFPPKGPIPKDASPRAERSGSNTRPDGTVKIALPSFQNIDADEQAQTNDAKAEHAADYSFDDRGDVLDRDFGEYERFLPKKPSDRRAKSKAEEGAPLVFFPGTNEGEQQELPIEELDTPKPRRAKKAAAYTPPPISLLNLPPKAPAAKEDPAEKAQILEETLASFGISARVTNISQGPSITRFELQPAPGVRVNRITNLSDDIALSLAAPRVRIEAPIPGKAAIGVEVPNRSTTAVTLRELLASPEFSNDPSKVTVALGRDITGKITLADLSRMPHLLIAGSTGSGKSVCINSIICSLVYHAAPEDVKLILVDPKVVELAVFANLPHLLVPVVTDPKKAAGALNWAVSEMIQRYKNFSQRGAREISRYNSIITADGEDKLPQIVIIIDELADLMMVAPDDVEDAICRIAQMGRAAGIHLCVATQRPSADVITGTIKGNIPSRIAFAVASAIDSRIILDSSGAEKLLGRGDMLYSPIGSSQATRVQGALVTDLEVERIAEYFQNQNMGSAIDQTVVEKMESAGSVASEDTAKADAEDDLLAKAVEVVLTTGQASISMLQRRMRLGYARAARLIDIMEQRNIISGYDGSSKPRKLLIDRAGYERIFGFKPNIPDLGS